MLHENKSIPRMAVSFISTNKNSCLKTWSPNLIYKSSFPINSEASPVDVNKLILTGLISGRGVGGIVSTLSFLKRETLAPESINIVTVNIFTLAKIEYRSS
jgi:hypothetical protein